MVASHITICPPSFRELLMPLLGLEIVPFQKLGLHTKPSLKNGFNLTKRRDLRDHQKLSTVKSDNQNQIKRGALQHPNVFEI